MRSDGDLQKATKSGDSARQMTIVDDSSRRVDVSSRELISADESGGESTEICKSSQELRRQFWNVQTLGNSLRACESC